MGRKVSVIAGGIAAGVLLSGAAWALEMTANENIKNVNNGLETRMAAHVAALTAVNNAQDDKLTDIYAKLDLINADLASIKARLTALENAGSGGEAPAGTIAAFDLTTCPTGWTRYTAGDGRFLVGLGTAGGRTYSTVGSAVDSASAGGAAFLTLTQAYLPAVSLDVYFSKWVSSDDAAGSGQVLMANRKLSSSSANGGLGITAKSKTEKMGSGTAFDNRPPFRVVLYCKKS